MSSHEHDLDIKHEREYQEIITRAEELFLMARPILSDPEVIAYFHALLNARRKAVSSFAETIGWICSECRGYCCGLDIQDNFSNLELLLYRFFNKKMPEPDLEFLKRVLRNKLSVCLFLGEGGCLLKEFRPTCCLRHLDCPRIGNCRVILDDNKWKKMKVLLNKYLEIKNRPPKVLIDFLEEYRRQKEC